jgi:hypothetical protein
LSTTEKGFQNKIYPITGSRYIKTLNYFSIHTHRYTLASGDDDGAGAKEDKRRLTVMLSVNGYGSDTSIVVIGKSKTPRNCNSQFWKENGVDYFSNS